jgi:CheY-like chemotaxis protein
VETSDGHADGKAEQKPLVLMIEDDPDVAYVVRLLLEDEGYRVEWRDDGRAGLDAATQLRPTVVVLDLRLPSLPGPQVLRALKAAPETRRIPVIVLSAVADRLDPALRAASAAVLSKPTDAQDLFDAVRAALRAEQPIADPEPRSAEPGA